MRESDYKSKRENLGVDEYIHYLDYDDSFMSVHVCQHLKLCALYVD